MPFRLAGDVGYPLVVKAQVLSGGRGKEGGVRLVHDPRELRAATRRMLAMTIAGKPVVAVLLEKAIAVGRWVDDADSYLQPRADPHRGWSVSGGGMDSQACPTGR